MRGIEPYKEIIMIKKTNKEMRNVKDLFYSTLFVFITLPLAYMCGDYIIECIEWDDIDSMFTFVYSLITLASIIATYINALRSKNA